ncbi:phage tail sheath subtilisin-like domain-containing protein [Sorangium sp. So ce887]
MSTTTTGFIGPCRSGPVDLENELITSLGEFELTYGDRQQLQVGTDFMHNYLWHAVRAFFTEGGKRLYVSRVFRRLDDSAANRKKNEFEEGAGPNAGGLFNDGFARGALPGLAVRARYQGAAGNLRVRLTLRIGQNVLSPSGTPLGSKASVTGALRDRDVVLVKRAAGSAAADQTGCYLALWNQATQGWDFTDSVAAKTITVDNLADHALRVVSLSVAVIGETALVWDGLALDANHTSNGSADALTARFSFDQNNPAENRAIPVVINAVGMTDGLALLNALAPATPLSALRTNLEDPRSSDASRTIEVLLAGGNDGQRPSATQYEGGVDDATMRKTGLAQLEDLEDISIVAAPGSTFGLERGYAADASTIVNLLIAHAQRMRYRIAVLDSGDGQSLGQVRAMRAKIDSSYAALYYPWVKVLDPVTRVPIFLPPSGFVAGIYARNDTDRAVYKAPANEVVNLALGFEILLNKAQQDVLNPEGINAFRYFEGRGYRLWGARTVSSDPEWKYVNVRRYFCYLERSIDKGTQWAVFEPNGEALWANVRRTIEDFLLNEWQSGALLGDKPEKAYFVRCDRSTMTQNDLDNGRLICLIGVAPLKPAEFVIFRIGQWTADRKS